MPIFSPCQAVNLFDSPALDSNKDNKNEENKLQILLIELLREASKHIDDEFENIDILETFCILVNNEDNNKKIAKKFGLKAIPELENTSECEYDPYASLYLSLLESSDYKTNIEIESYILNFSWKNHVETEAQENLLLKDIGNENLFSLNTVLLSKRYKILISDRFYYGVFVINGSIDDNFLFYKLIILLLSTIGFRFILLSKYTKNMKNFEEIISLQNFILEMHFFDDNDNYDVLKGNKFSRPVYYYKQSQKQKYRSYLNQNDEEDDIMKKFMNFTFIHEISAPIGIEFRTIFDGQYSFQLDKLDEIEKDELDILSQSPKQREKSLPIFLQFCPIYSFQNPSYPISDKDHQKLLIELINMDEYISTTCPIVNIYGNLIDYEDMYDLKPMLFSSKQIYLSEANKQHINKALETRKTVEKDDLQKIDQFLSFLKDHTTIFSNLKTTFQVGVINSVNIALSDNSEDKVNFYINSLLNNQSLEPHFKLQMIGVLLKSKRSLTLYAPQILTVLDALNQIKIGKKGVIYQIETGEGKSIIISILTAILASKKFISSNFKVHIVSSNIKLSIRDYQKTMELFEELNFELKDEIGVLLHKTDNNKYKIYQDEKAKDTENNQNQPKDQEKPEKNQNNPNETKAKKEIMEFDEETNMNICIAEKKTIIFSTFLNFESLYLHKIQVDPFHSEELYSKSVLLIDEADELLIDQITNGTILSRPVISNSDEILHYFEEICQTETDDEKILNEIKDKFPESSDLRLCDIKEMRFSLKIAEEFTNDKHYIIAKNQPDYFETVINRKRRTSDPNAYFKNKEKGNECLKDHIIPYAYEGEGLPQFNLEFCLYIQQFIAIKENKKRKKRLPIQLKPLSIDFLRISHSIYVKKYKHVFGFTGTLGNSKELNIYDKEYDLSTVIIPRNKPNIRCDYKDSVVKDKKYYSFLLREIMYYHQLNRPILVIYNDLEMLNRTRDKLESRMKKIGKEDDFNKNVFVVKGKRDDKDPEELCKNPNVIILASTYCGRGQNTNADNLHVIIANNMKNGRALLQAKGRAARVGKAGSSHLICTIDSYKNPEYSKNKNKTKDDLEEFQIINNKQHQYMKKLNKSDWLFSGVEKYKFSFSGAKTLKDDEIITLRDHYLNVNRLTAVDYPMPLGMSLKTFLNIQSQKIYSLINTPNTRYSWYLIACYIREMFLESWCLFLTKFKQDYMEKHQNFMKTTFQKELDAEYSVFIDKLKKYTGIKRNKDKKMSITDCFIKIIEKVQRKWKSKIDESFKVITSKYEIFNKYNQPDKFLQTKFFKYRFGIYPLLVLDYSGARVNDKFISDPEIFYEDTRKKELFSITKTIDEIFNQMLEDVADTFGKIPWLKFIFRRTLAGADFGVCFVLNKKVQTHDAKHCLMDSQPVFMLLISLNNGFQLFSGILILIATVALKHFKEIQNLITNPAEFVAELIIDKIKEKAQDKINEKVDKVIDKLISKAKTKIPGWDGSNLKKVFEVTNEKIETTTEKIKETTEKLFKILDILNIIDFDTESGPDGLTLGGITPNGIKLTFAIIIYFYSLFCEYKAKKQLELAKDKVKEQEEEKKKSESKKQNN